MNTMNVLILITLLAFTQLSYSQSTDGVDQINNAVTNLQNAAQNYSIIISLLSNSTFSTALNLTDGTSKTLFAPTNSAFASLDSSITSQLSDADIVITVLKYHVVPAYLPSETITTALSSSSIVSVPTLLGSNLTVTTNGSSIFVDNSTVIEPNIAASGVVAVHGISSVLIPPSSVNGSQEVQTVVTNLTTSTSGNFSILLSLLANSTYSTFLNLTDGSNKTIFAPTNEAFAALPSSVSALLSNVTIVQTVLAYHIIPSYYLPSTTVLEVLSSSNNSTSVPTIQGEFVNVTLSSELKVNNATVIATDIVDSGVTAVHAINGVLLPPSLVSTVGSSTPTSPPPASPPPPTSDSSNTVVSVLVLATLSVASILLV